MSDKIIKYIVICTVLAITVIAVAPSVVTRRGSEARMPIFVNQQGVFEYDWDPADPDFPQTACVRYSIRESAFFDSYSASQMSDDQMWKVVNDECDAARAKAKRRGALLGRLK